MIKKIFTSDKYTKGRGKFKKRIEIRCANCSDYLFSYQKEGSGVLEKIFFDLILDNQSVKNNKKLVCTKCDKVLGIRFIFGKEKRDAFKLYPGAVYWKIFVPKVEVIKREGYAGR